MRSPADRRTALLMLLPSLVLLAIFVYGFIFQTIRTSMTDWGENLDPTAAPMAVNPERNYVGLENYEELMTNALQFDFRVAMVNTFFFTILFVGGCVLLGGALALLLDFNVRLEGVFRTIFLLPMSLSLIVTGTVWRWLLQPEGLNSLPARLFGLEPLDFQWLNNRDVLLEFDWNDVPLYLTIIGIFILSILVFNFAMSKRWGAAGWGIGIVIVLLFMYGVGFWENTIWPPVGIAGEEGFVMTPEPKGYQVALTGIILAAVWQMSGYVMAIFLAGIRGIPEELREAARVDGCNEINVYTRIILPQLRPVALSAIIILGHISLKIFDLVFAMSGLGNFQTKVPGIMVYSAFQDNRFATASAIAVIMLLLVSVVIIPYLWSQLRAEE